MTPAAEHVHAVWTAFQTGGLDATLGHVAEDCEWIPSPDFPDRRPVRGAAQMREYLGRLKLEGVRFESALHTCEEVAGEAVLVGGRLRVVSRAALSDSPLFWLYRLRGARIVRVESFPSRAEALRAAAA